MNLRWRVFGGSVSRDQGSNNSRLEASTVERDALDRAAQHVHVLEQDNKRLSELISAVLADVDAVAFEIAAPYGMDSALRWYSASRGKLADWLTRSAPANLRELGAMVDPRDRVTLTSMLGPCLASGLRNETVAHRVRLMLGQAVLSVQIRLCVVHEATGAVERCAGLLRDDSYAATLEREFEQVKARFDCGRDLIEDGLWDTEMIQDRADDARQNYWWSPQFKRLLGFGEHQDEFHPVLDSWAGRLHVEDRDRVFAAFAAHLEDFTNQTPYDVEYRIKKRDGTFTWLRARCMTQRLTDGTPLRVVGSVSDISHRKREEAHRLAQEERAAQNDKHVRDIGAVSEVIQRLTQQSMLLGMNAAVEAARAGASGTGFAVIAGEMRDLSAKISQAAAEIARLQAQVAGKT